MPLYEYLCRDCGQLFEKMVRMSEQDLAPICPTCGGADTRKQISTFATRGFSSSTSLNVGSGSCSPTGSFS